LKRKLTYFALLTSVGAAAAIYFYCQLNRQPTLAQLQQKYLAAQNDSDRARIIDQVEEYYLHLSVEDSIRQRIEQNVAALVDTTRPSLSDFDGGWDSPDLYALESRQKQLLKAAMIVCAQSSPQECAAFLQKAEERAAFVDSKTQHQYWTALVEKMRAYSKKAALAYLRSIEAAALCARWIDGNYQAAEQSGALALRYLRTAPNERLRLEVMQRFQYILFLFRNLNALSIALGERNWPAAEKVGDYLRMTGILYYQAEAYKKGGEIKRVLKQCQHIQTLAVAHNDISEIKWYQKNALTFTAESYWWLRDYEKALDVISEIEQSNQSAEIINLKGLIFQSLGVFEKAESEFKQSITLADSSEILFNKIQFRINLGRLYQSLTEYELASTFYNQALQLLSKIDIDQSRLLEILLIPDFSAFAAEKPNPEIIKKLINLTNQILADDEFTPLTEAGIHQTLGQRHSALQNHQDALKSFQTAERICDRNRLLAFGWEVKINVAKTLLTLAEYNLARKKAMEVLAASEQQNEYEFMIDALGTLAEIERQGGDLQQAIAISNQCVQAIEEVSRGFEDANRLAAFRQRMYDYLKQAVLYEIYCNRLDSALTKLNYAKSRVLQRFANFDNGILEYPFKLSSLKNSLDDQQVILDYLVAYDTLYAFVMTRQGSTLLKKKNDLAELKKNISGLRANINQTIAIFKNYDSKVNRFHFTENSSLSYNLFEKLMGWSELQGKIDSAKIIYIIPDEFLSQVPFAALVVDTTKEVRYLVEKIAISYLPALSFLQPQSRMTNISERRKKRVLISANQSIPGAAELIAFLQKAFLSVEEMRTSSLPTKQHILEQLKNQHDIYIVVGHGVANPLEPERSQIEFTIKDKQTGESEIFPLTIADLKGTNWFGAEMVMLVGCETASGKLYRGTGTAGLQQWFVAMGAENVLGTLWKVDAEQTLSQIEDFFKLWLENGHSAKALQEAQSAAIKKLRQHNYFKFPHPYYWGANNFIGRYQ
jgi:CHAT domain-containing protein